MNTVRALLPILALAVAGCARPIVPPVPADVSVIRSYSCATDVEDPQPAWNPATYQVVMRVAHGFILFQEGRDRREVFISDDRRETGLPAWINPGQFAFGPLANVIRLADGRWVSSADGLSILTVTDNGFKSAVSRQQLSAKGFRPRPWHEGEMVAQDEDRLVRIDGRGRMIDEGLGFRGEPQRGGEGLAWQETPVPYDDPWTGKPPRGRLTIRWRPGVITEVPSAVQARWCADGRVVATVMRADPPAKGPWWEGGTDVVVVAQDGSVRVIAANCRDGDPHPRHPLVAVTERMGGIRIAALDPGPDPRLLVPTGRKPRWSADGLRLLAEEDPAKDGQQGCVVKFHVLRIEKEPVAAK
jgi:hypothetical protein